MQSQRLVTLRNQPQKPAAKKSFCARNPYLFNATVRLPSLSCDYPDFLKLLFYSQDAGWKVIFTPEALTYFREKVFPRSLRWYKGYLKALYADKYIKVYRSPEGHIVVERRNNHPPKTNLCVPLKEAMGGNLNMREMYILAKARYCTFNKQLPELKHSFRARFNVSTRSIERDIKGITDRRLAEKTPWTILKPFEYEEGMTDEEYFSQKGRYYRENRGKKTFALTATKKARINLDDFKKPRQKSSPPPSAKNDPVYIQTSDTSHPQDPPADFCRKLLYNNKNLSEIGLQGAKSPASCQALRSRDPIFSQIINSLTNLSAKGYGYGFGERWYQEPELYRAARWLARQEGVTKDRVLAWESKLATHSFLKSVLRDGWKAAIEGDYAKKGGAVWDKSSHLGKYRDQGWRAKNLIYRFADILQGKYDRQELSTKAKGSAWGEDGSPTAPNTSVKRTEVPGEWFKNHLQEITAQEVLRALLVRLWKKLGWSTYETLIDPCEIVKNDEGRWVVLPPNRFHAKLLEEKLKLHWWRVVLPTTNKPVRSKLREAYTAWLKENPASQAPQEEKAEDATRAVTENITTSREEERSQEMGIVPANDDEGVIPHWSEQERSAKKARKDHRSRRTQSEDMEARGRESEEEILRERKERQERLLNDISNSTNIHASEKALRIDTIKRHGINAYNRWFNRCRVDIADGAAKYIAPNDFIAVEIERRYGVQLNTHAK